MAGAIWWRAGLRRAGFYLRPGPKLRGRGSLHSSSAGPRGAGGGGGLPPVSELDKADAWLLRKAHETGHSFTSSPTTPSSPSCTSCGKVSLMVKVSTVRRGLVNSEYYTIKDQDYYQVEDLSTGFLSWFRNGLLATGIGVISYVQSDVGQEAAYGFFILGGVCVSYGSASYLANLVLLRRTMMLSFSASVLSGAAILSLCLFWVCAISLYIGRLEVEIIREDNCEDCKDEKNDGKSEK